MTWVLATLIAAAAQTARNATQNGLTRAIGTVGATQVRFLFGLPFAVLFLSLTTLATGDPVPTIPLRSLGFTALGAVAQIGATALMLSVMKSQSFAITTAWIKTEPILVALIAAVILGDPLTWPALAAIVLATSGVVLMSLTPGTGARLWQETTPAAMGLVAGALFGLAAIGFRGAILALPTGGFLVRSSTILVLGLALQCVLLLVWMALFNRAAIRASIAVWPRSLGAGFLGAFASQFWFIGFALTSAANVRTLALVELVFATAVSRLWLRQSLGGRQVLGMAIILAGVGLLVQTA